MLPVEFVVVVVLIVTECVKRGLGRVLKLVELDPGIAPLIAILVGILLNLLNAVVFESPVTADALRDAARHGALAAAAAAGVWSAGKQYVTRSQS